jgi:multimeric flavodoxin WrbA
MKLIITDIKDPTLHVKGEHKIIKPDAMVKHCIGCFGCWIKTPGECVIKDGFHCTGWDMGKCEELIMISECLYGGFSSFVKKVQDRGISYVRPDFSIVNNEMRHRRRYSNKIKLSVYFYGEDITKEEKITAENIVKANAKNFYAVVEKVMFLKKTEELAEVEL